MALRGRQRELWWEGEGGGRLCYYFCESCQLSGVITLTWQREMIDSKIVCHL